MDDKSTPISSLNNRNDSEVVNDILSKYNNLQDGNTNISPLDNNMNQMENQFENRNLNKEIYNLNSNNVAYKEHYEKELARTNQTNNQNNNIEEETYEEDYEDEYEIVEIPLWRKVLNEIKIPFFIFIFILLISNCTFDKILLRKIPYLGNQYNECNTYGFLLKAFLISLFSYILIRFVRF